MFWLLTLILLAIANGQDPDSSPKPTNQPTLKTETPSPSPSTVVTSSTTTPDDTKPADIDQKLKDLLSKYKASGQVNAELSNLLDHVELALKLDEKYSAEKMVALTKMQEYDKVDTILKKKISDRIDKINDLLPTLTPNSKCSKFYLNQRNILKEIEKLSHAEQETRLTENSVECTTDDDADDYSEYINIFDEDIIPRPRTRF